MLKAVINSDIAAAVNSVTAADNSLNISPNTGAVTASVVVANLSGTAAALNIGGNAVTVSVQDAASDATTWVLLAGTQTGNQTPETDAGITYDANANLLSTSVAGNASTVTTNANSTGDVTSVGNATTVTAVGTYQVAGFRNAIINGAFDVWQKGGSAASFTPGTGSSITADAWTVKRTVTSFTVSLQTGTPPAGFIQYARVQRTASDTQTNTITFGTTPDWHDAAKWAGKSVTFSYYARSGANYSPTSGILQARLITDATHTNEDVVTGFTSATNTISVSDTLTTSFQRFTHTATLPSPMTEFGVTFAFNPIGTAGAADYFDICGVQVEFGSTVTPFEFLPLGDVLYKCRRYYQKSFPQATAPVQSGGVAGSIQVKNPIALGDPSEYIQFQPPLYPGTITFTTYNPSAGNANWRDITAAADATVSVDPGSGKSETGILVATSGTVTTLGDILAIHYTASAYPGGTV